MSRIARLALFVAALSSLTAALASTAGAVTWHNGGDTAFTATAGPTTISSTSAAVACPAGATVTGTVAASPFVGFTWPAASGTAVFTGCAVGVSGWSVHCQYAVTAQSWTAGLTNGSVDLSCKISLAGSVFCITENAPTATPGTYTNPSGGTPGRGTLPATAPVKVTNGPAGSCALGNGDIATLTDQIYTVTSGTGGPNITRTA